MVSQRVIELRCERCQVSFAPGTRRCVHCGGRLVPARVLGAPPEAASPSPRPFPSRDRAGGARGSAAPAGPAPGAAGGADDEDIELPPRVHNIIWVVTALLAILGAILGRC